jgi:alkylation response protein AidB-like acyl-CoA dehydrogenase
MQATLTATEKLTKGGEFLIRPFTADETAIPEARTEEQNAIGDMCNTFIATEILPQVEALDAMKDPLLMPSLLDKAGALGLLGVSIPETYGGLGLDVSTAMLTTEILGSANSFSVAVLAHTGIGTLPIYYYGTPAQKAKYLPRLASGEWKASYCLTEPGAGSDARSGKTRAELTADGEHYVINGQKMWITNGGFADVFTVFAQVDGNKFTAFIIEKGTPGISMNEEEKKMGIKGSSTRQIFFTDVKVPIENLLGEIGKGHHVAFNILNIGRLKLSAACVGSCKRVIELSVRYATERQQFGQPIGEFGAIMHKMAEQAIRTYSCEAATYRAAHDIDRMEQQLLASGSSTDSALLAAAEEFASECAIMKVHGSEVLDYVCDEGVQIYGGYGFSAEYPMDRAYRDSRINRIYEGTNEINRMLSVSYLLKRAIDGKLDLFPAAMAVQQELLAGTETPLGTGEFAHEHRLAANLKKAVLMVAGAAAQKYTTAINKEQEILMSIADMLMETYVYESTLLRVEKLVQLHGADAAERQMDILRCLGLDAAARTDLAGRTAEGEMLKGLLGGLRKLTRTEPYNTVAARRRISQHLTEKQTYAF